MQIKFDKKANIIYAQNKYKLLILIINSKTQVIMYTFFLVVLTILMIVCYLKRWFKASIPLWIINGFLAYDTALEWGLDPVWRWAIIFIPVIVAYSVGWIIDNSR